MRAYSLIEFVIVLAVIGIILALSTPGLRGYSENYRLYAGANLIKQTIAQARIQSLGASGRFSGMIQYYQVNFGNFPQPAVNQTTTPQLIGNESTNQFSLNYGFLSCDDQPLTQATPNTPIKSFDLPHNVYIASFYPYQASSNDGTDPIQSAIRFFRDEQGFRCGNANDPLIKSTESIGIWQVIRSSGENQDVINASANELYLEVKSVQTERSLYVTVNRLNGAVELKTVKDIPIFAPFTDELPPRWVNPDYPCGLDHELNDLSGPDQNVKIGCLGPISCRATDDGWQISARFQLAPLVDQVGNNIDNSLDDELRKLTISYFIFLKQDDNVLDYVNVNSNFIPRVSNRLPPSYNITLNSRSPEHSFYPHQNFIIEFGYFLGSSLLEGGSISDPVGKYLTFSSRFSAQGCPYTEYSSVTTRQIEIDPNVAVEDDSTGIDGN